MDITPKYILMSEKAEKMQKDWEPQIGDYFHDKNYPGAYGIWQSSLPLDTIVWLPRQDQLQALVSTLHNQETTLWLCERFNRSIQGYAKEPIYQLSMEQLWLAFVMHEKYQKQWDEEKEEWTK